MSIATQIQRLQSAKAALATSIENKGVTVPSSTKLDGYAALVDQIQQGGGEGDTIIIYGGHAQNKSVGFIDCDGSVLATYSAAELADLSALPAAPAAKSGLVFEGWSKTLQEIKNDDFDDWICARYTLSEAETLIANIYIPISSCGFSITGLRSNVGASLNQAYTIDWGDGNSNSSSVTTSHVYASAGYYTVKMTSEPGGVFYCYKNLFNTRSAQYVMSLYIPDNFELGSLNTTYYTNPVTNSSFGSVFNMRPDGYIVVDDNNTSSDVDLGMFANTNIFWLNTENMTAVSGAGAFAHSSIHAISSITELNARMFFNCKYLKQLKVRSGASCHIGEEALYNTEMLQKFDGYAGTGSGAANETYTFATTSADSLREIWFSSTTYGISNTMFAGRYGVNVYLPVGTPPNLSSSSNLDGIIFYVPNAALEYYEIADNWSVLYANNQILGYNFV